MTPSRPFSSLIAICCLISLAPRTASGAVFSVPGSTATVTSSEYSPVANDLFDVSQGLKIISASPAYQLAPVDSMFGGPGFLSGDANNTLFGDGGNAGTVHTVVFSAPSAVTVRSIRIGFSQDGDLTRRGAAGYSLLGLQSSTDTGVVLSQAALAGDYVAAYGYSNITVEDTFLPFTGSFFRFNVVQRTDFYGPRVQEIDGFATAVPEPSAYALAFAGLACGCFRAWRRRSHGCRRIAALPTLAIFASVTGVALTGSCSAIAGTATWSASSGGNDHAYELVGPGVYWNEAVSGAASRTPPDGYQQGQLASITSAAENDFLRAAFGEGSAWFGFTDEAVEGEWRWTDGSTGIWQDPKVFPSPIQTTYVNWITGEPNNSYDSGEDYAIIYLSYGGWNDGVGPDSGTKFLYLVEYSPVPVPEPSTAALALAGLTCTAWIASRRRGNR